MKILGIEHVAMATDSLEKAAVFWRDILGIRHTQTEVVQSQGVTAQIYDTGHGKVELLEQHGEQSPIAKFLARRGPGIHHVCLQVDDIQSAVSQLKSRGIRLVTEEPQPGGEGCFMIFIHPESTGGVLVELCQRL